jgi:hypothetical protein
MKKFLFSCLLFLQPNYSDVNKESLVGSIAYIENGEIIPIGSGMYIESGIGPGVLTAKHVAEGGEELEKELYICNLRLTQCDELQRDYISSSSSSLYKDWAFYKKEVDFLYKLKKFSNYSISDDVFLIGSSWGKVPWVSEGNVAWDDEIIFYVDAFCAPGCSGGAVFNEKNELIGLIVALYSGSWGPETNQIIAIPVKNIEIIK